jgi:hypothetical protein
MHQTSDMRKLNETFKFYDWGDESCWKLVFAYTTHLDTYKIIMGVSEEEVIDISSWLYGACHTATY